MQQQPLMHRQANFAFTGPFWELNCRTMYIGYFNKDASHSLDLLVCMVKCSILFFQRSSHYGENVKCSESLHGRDNIVDPHTHTHTHTHTNTLEDNIKIDLKKVVMTMW